MKYININIIVLFAACLLSCSVADNQSCSTNKLLENAANGELEKIAACYKSGADILISDKDAVAIYTIARDNGHFVLAKRFQEIQFAEWQKNNSLMEAQIFYDAIEYDNVPMVNKFIDSGFDLQAKHINGVAPIVYAVFNESNEVVELLLNNEIDVHYEFDFRPLICIATMFNQQETVNILISHGADVSAHDGTGVTALMFAARDGYSEIIKILLAHGANKSAVDIRGDTAHDMAEANGHTELVKLLSE
jgi:ankyrin repeat protein